VVGSRAFSRKLAPFVAAAATAVALCVGGGCAGIAAQGRNAHGVQLYDQGRYEEAVREFEHALSIDPENADAYYNLAAAYHHLGVTSNNPAQLAQAEQYYNMCRHRNGSHRECHRGLAVLLVEQERSEEAFRLLENWVATNPTLAEPRIELARLYEEFGEPHKAKEHLVDALYVDSENPRALAALGQLREKLGEHELALKNYQESLWYDRFQPDVESRIAALQSSRSQTGVSPSPSPAPATASETRIATRGTPPLR